MSQYATLDNLIVEAIRLKKNPLYARAVAAEADRIAMNTGRESFRVIDGRLIALRKRKVIEYLKKGVAPDGKQGWYLPPPPPAEPVQGLL